MMPGGSTEISFFNVDSIFDFLLGIGMKPFIEIGFMPSAFASGDNTGFYYKNNITPPKDYEEWAEFIRLFGRHLIDRYGTEEISQWFFEVWNEPNLSFFWFGGRNEYFKFYRYTAEALKSVDVCFRVGGPATSVNEWIPEFRAFCENSGAPLDFITTHHYPNDDPLTVFGKNKADAPFIMPTKEDAAQMTPEERQKIMEMFLPHKNTNPRDILRQMTVKAKEEAGPYPLYYTEWNGALEFDTSYQATFITHTAAYNEGLVDIYSFWCVSDIFEEQGLKGTPFKNEYGIQTIHGVPKPSYRMFEVLHRAGDKRIPVESGHKTAEVLALKDGKRVTVFVYNHDIDRRNIKAENILLKLRGSINRIRKTVIDENHCNPLLAWENMGKPKYPTKDELAAINKASELVYEDLLVTNSLEFTAAPESVTVFVIE
jgi:xylan 1,4-beta-xylosidase